MGEDQVRPTLERLAFGSAVTGSLDEYRHFEAETMERLGAEFTLPEELLDGLRYELEMLARGYWEETRRFRADQAAIRRQIRCLAKAAKGFAAAFDELTPEGWEVLAGASVGRSLLGKFGPRLTAAADDSPQGHTWQLQSTGGNGPRTTLDIGTLRRAAEALSDCADRAMVAAGHGKPGRPDDEAPLQVMLGLYVVWRILLGRSFKLDWTSRGLPITDAARFCRQVARIVDPRITAARVATGARKAREIARGAKNLEELHRCVGEYYMRKK